MDDEQNAELAILLSESQAMATTVTNMERDISALRARRMAIVKTIFDRFGKGPFDISGEPYVIMVRPGKDPEQSGYFLQRKLLPKPKPAKTPPVA